MTMAHKSTFQVFLKIIYQKYLSWNIGLFYQSSSIFLFLISAIHLRNKISSKRYNFLLSYIHFFSQWGLQKYKNLLFNKEHT